jgi:hypothetical protein
MQDLDLVSDILAGSHADSLLVDPITAPAGLLGTANAAAHCRPGLSRLGLTGLRSVVRFSTGDLATLSFYRPGKSPIPYCDS